MVETITVGNLPWTVTYDSGNNALYVTNSGADTVSVISGASTTSSTPNSNPNSFDFGSITWIIVIIVIILLIIIILVWLSRQRKFIVLVQNSQTQTALAGATVTAEGQKKLQVNTKDNGEAVFKDFDDADYIITATASGYIPSQPIKVSVKNKAKVLVKLDPTKPAPAPTNAAIPTAPKAPAAAPKPVTPPPTPQVTQERDTEQIEGNERIQEIVRTFQAKGAISPETAMTADELGLSRLFVRVMKRRQGKTQFFKEVNGKYYLDQNALREGGQQ